MVSGIVGKSSCNAASALIIQRFSQDVHGWRAEKVQMI
jgi:hypothetical protein